MADYLRALYRASGCTYPELAARTAQAGRAVSVATLKRAVHRTKAPRETTVAAFVAACGGGIDQEQMAARLWRAARAEERGILAGLQTPSIDNIRTQADLAAALAAAYERAGAPPLRTVQERAGTADVEGAVVLPTTTIWRIVHRRGQPVDWRQCAAFLRGCGLNKRRLEPWRHAWQRATSVHTISRSKSAAPEPTPPLLAYIPGTDHWSHRWQKAEALAARWSRLPKDGGLPGYPEDPKTTVTYYALPRSPEDWSDLLSELGLRDRYALLASGFAHLIEAYARLYDTSIDSVDIQGGSLRITRTRGARRRGSQRHTRKACPYCSYCPPDAIPRRSAIRTLTTCPACAGPYISSG
ncbi:MULTISPECIES: hypothetical protein [unclassified Streptomyces]|uniref:hypothetical protein n=1 Tax=unclassified Streptomyces TaxID=2593676 RepID=UPI0036F8CFD9